MKRRKTYSNWARNQTCQPLDYVQPASREELLDALRQSRAENVSARAVGATHSMSGLVNTNGRRVSLDRLNRVLRFDRDDQTVTVEAGIRLYQLVHWLAAREMALPMLGSITEQSIAGAVSTGTHSSCRKKPILATLVTELEIICPTGEQRRFSSSENGDLFDAVRVSRGELGIISELTVRTEQLRHAVEELQTLPFEEMMADLESFLAHDHFRFFWVPGSDRVFTQVIDKMPVENGFQEFLPGRLCERMCWCLWIARGLFGPKPSTTLRQTGRSDRLFCYPRPFVRLTGIINRVVGGRRSMLNSEYGIPIDCWNEVASILQIAARDGKILSRYPLEVRFGASDNIWLSPAYQRDTCYIGFYAEDRQGDLEPFRQFEELLRPFRPRPHWGKIHFFKDHDCRQAFPRWNDFLSVRAELRGEARHDVRPPADLGNHSDAQSREEGLG